MRWLQAILLSVLLTIPTLLAAQSRKPATVAEIAAYMGRTANNYSMREQKQKASLPGTHLWQVTRTKPWRAPSKRNIPACASKFFAPAAAS
jgi:hypothetical protein